MANNLVIDPVCGTKLDSTKVQFTTDYEGMRYYFCSDKCKHRFDHDPEAYRQAGLTATNTSE